MAFPLKQRTLEQVQYLLEESRRRVMETEASVKQSQRQYLSMVEEEAQAATVMAKKHLQQSAEEVQPKVGVTESIESSPLLRGVQEQQNAHQVVYRRPQARKNKTWTGDATLEVKDSGVTLRCSETKKVLFTGFSSVDMNSFHGGDVVNIGEYEVQLS